MQATVDQTYEGIAEVMREVGYSGATAKIVADVHRAVQSKERTPHGPTGAAAKMYVIAAVQTGALEGAA